MSEWLASARQLGVKFFLPSISHFLQSE